MNTKQLRQKILDLAIRGQLVPQDSNDEPASVLLEKIRAEKQTLIEQKKIKKDKKSSYITCDLSPYRKYTEHFADGSSKDITDEIPFEIPENWAWCRLGEIINLLSGQDLNSKEYNDIRKGIPYITGASNFSKNKLEINRWTEFEKNIAKKGDILITCKGTIGEMTILEIDRVHIARQLMSIDTIINNQKYILYFLTFKLKEIQQKASGLIPGINREDILLQIIPLPPLSEQRRIVEKIEELLALVDDLETNKTDLQSYIKQAKSKVLEMAVRGELVPQNPEDEPASVLLERIKKEQKSSKSKGKTTEHNTHYEEELPFDIPENWAWCRLGEITMINPKNNIEDNKEVSFIPMTLISDGFSNKHSYEVRLWGEVKKGFTHFQEGDIGIAKITPCFENRKSVIFSNLVNEVGAGTTELHILRPFAYSEIKKYIYWFINTESFIQRGISHFSGAVGQQRVGKDILENTLIPLPPLSEQHRIVEKIEEIFSELEFIEEALI